MRTGIRDAAHWHRRRSIHAASSVFLIWYSSDQGAGKPCPSFSLSSLLKRYLLARQKVAGGQLHQQYILMYSNACERASKQINARVHRFRRSQEEDRIRSESMPLVRIRSAFIFKVGHASSLLSVHNITLLNFL